MDDRVQGGAAAPLEHPTPKFPAPPFEKQKQPWPGLAKRMNPPPDHGETSYKGAGRLTGRKALVTGGDSGMGRAAAIAFAREGADVAINYFPNEEEDARDVIAVIEQAGRKASAWRSAGRSILPKAGPRRARRARRARPARHQRRAPAGA